MSSGIHLSAHFRRQTPIGGAMYETSNSVMSPRSVLWYVLAGREAGSLGQGISRHMVSNEHDAAMIYR